VIKDTDCAIITAGSLSEPPRPYDDVLPVARYLGGTNVLAIRLLAVGDIHLGRRPRSIPEAVAAVFPPHVLSPAAAWQRAVQLALSSGVDAVVLAGDVIDREDDYFEAYGTLEQGVRRLVDAGIPVLGVAGNHDVDVLPRLARAIPQFKLLGANGCWEAYRLEGRRPGAGSARIIGWSFPTARYSQSPLACPTASAVLTRPSKPEPVIGLLHCDRDGSGSTHAPVTSAELDAAPVDAWLLGHVHAPDLSDTDRPIGYLGSVVGLDPTEVGGHGPWLVEVDRHAVRARHVPNAPLRWEHVTIDFSEPDCALDDGVPAAEWLERALPRVLEQSIACLPDGYRPDVLGCRVRITGRTSRRAELERALERSNASGWGEPWVERDGVWAFPDKITLATSLHHPLETLAATRDPVGLMAAKVLVLERLPEDLERQRLLEEARARVQAIRRRTAYRGLSDADLPPSDEALAAMLRESALRSIDLLLAQSSHVVLPASEGHERGADP